MRAFKGGIEKISDGQGLGIIFRKEKSFEYIEHILHTYIIQSPMLKKEDVCITVKKHARYPCVVYLKLHFSHGTWSQYGNLDDLTQKIGFTRNLLCSNKYIVKKDAKIQFIY